MKLFIARSALNDLQEIKSYYLEQGVPDIGRKVPEFDQEHIREIIHAPFRVVDLRNASSLNLIRVWRSERLLRLPDEET